MSDAETLREALASAQLLVAAQSQRLREQELVLSGIRDLSAEDEPRVLLERMFDLLRQALPFDRAIVLEPRDGQFVCIASTDVALIGVVWAAGSFFQRVAGGRPSVTPNNSRIPEWIFCEGAAPLHGGAIYVPIVAPRGAGILILCSREHGAYTARDLALVSGLGLLVSQTLAAGQRRRLSDAVHRAQIEREAAVRANQVKSNFFANMSHEIRTPMNGVLAVADLLARTELSPRQQEMATLILESGRMLERLLNDVLDFSKIESGHLELEAEPFQLGAVVDGVVDLFASKAQAKGLWLRVAQTDAARVWFLGDSLRVRQVLSNLLSNAIKFTTSGGVQVSTDAEPDGDDWTVTVRVRDTGCGFGPEVAERLFERFEQADGSITRKFGGTGLGLAISRSLARIMGGDVDCQSAPGEGAQFEFRFRAAATATPEQAIAVEPEPELLERQGPRVLVAEDNANNRRIIGMILDLIGASVTFAEDGERAVALFGQQAFDVVLMDLQMPVMDGLTATRAIRAREASLGGRTPIVALSANAMTHHVAEALAAGADAHVAKPINPTALLGLLGDLETLGGEAAARATQAGRSGR